ncbi:MAG: ribosomal-processing cysteine protease Prp [Aristaeellaceae bacterium]
MTRCTLYLDSASRITGVSVSGHSGYAEEGSDIVCAGVSALVLTINNALDKLVGLKLVERTGDGLAEFFLPQSLTDQQMHDAQLLMSALHLGLENIAQDYPRFVRLATRKDREKRPSN